MGEASAARFDAPTGASRRRGRRPAPPATGRGRRFAPARRGGAGAGTRRDATDLSLSDAVVPPEDLHARRGPRAPRGRGPDPDIGAGSPAPPLVVREHLARSRAPTGRRAGRRRRQHLHRPAAQRLLRRGEADVTLTARRGRCAGSALRSRSGSSRASLASSWSASALPDAEAAVFSTRPRSARSASRRRRTSPSRSACDTSVASSRREDVAGGVPRQVLAVTPEADQLPPRVARAPRRAACASRWWLRSHVAAERARRTTRRR